MIIYNTGLLYSDEIFCESGNLQAGCLPWNNWMPLISDNISSTHDREERLLSPQTYFSILSLEVPYAILSTIDQSLVMESQANHSHTRGLDSAIFLCAQEENMTSTGHIECPCL